jgi:hypothetical protein
MPEGWLQSVPSRYASFAGARVARPLGVPGAPSANSRRS